MPSKFTVRRRILALATWATVVGSSLTSVFAQAGPVSNGAPLRAARLTARELARDAALNPVFQVTGSRNNIEIIEKLSKVLELDRKIIRVDGFDPEVIDVKALTPYRIRVLAKVQGVTNLVLTDENDVSYVVNVFIKGDARHLQAVLDNRFPDSSIEAYTVKDQAVALKGVVSQPQHITQIVEIAEEFYLKVLNQMTVGGVQQVMLKCKIMEVQRSKLRGMGFDFVAAGRSAFVRSNPAQLFALEAADTALGFQVTDGTLSAASSAFAFTGSQDVFQGFLDALKEEKLLKILSEPTLVAMNGRPASMLSGGEFPVLVPQSLGTVSIEWRDFGVRMEAVPIILGDGMVRIELMPEVSERDFANAVVVNGLTVPALTTRRVNTQVEMRFGQTLMLAGLISSRQTAETSKTPFLGELPWIGTLFRKVRYDDVETELIILITPELVAPMSSQQVPHGGPGTFTTFPTDRELYGDGFIEVPNYGDACSGCNGVRGCTTGCRAALGGPSVNGAIAVSVQKTTIPLTQADANRSITELMDAQRRKAGRGGVTGTSNNRSTVSRIPSKRVTGGTQRAGYIRPSVANRPPTNSNSPGLIEP